MITLPFVDAIVVVARTAPWTATLFRIAPVRSTPDSVEPERSTLCRVALARFAPVRSRPERSASKMRARGPTSTPRWSCHGAGSDAGMPRTGPMAPSRIPAPPSFASVITAPVHVMKPTVAPAKDAPLRSALSTNADDRLAPSRIAPASRAPSRWVACRSAPVRFAPVRFAVWRKAPARCAPDRSHPDQSTRFAAAGVTVPSTATVGQVAASAEVPADSRDSASRPAVVTATRRRRWRSERRDRDTIDPHHPTRRGRDDDAHVAAQPRRQPREHEQHAGPRRGAAEREGADLAAADVERDRAAGAARRRDDAHPPHVPDQAREVGAVRWTTAPQTGGTSPR